MNTALVSQRGSLVFWHRDLRSNCNTIFCKLRVRYTLTNCHTCSARHNIYIHHKALSGKATILVISDSSNTAITRD